MLGVVLTGGIVSSMSNSPAIAIISLTLGDNAGKLTYNFNPRKPEQAITVSGELGGQAYSETWAVDQQKQQVSITGALGDNPIAVTLSAGQKGFLAQGTIGQVGLTQVLGGESDFSQITTTGKLGTESLNHNIAVTQDEDQNYHLSVSGTLGQSTLEQTATIARSEDADLQFEAQGNLAGASFTMSGQLYAAQP